MLWKLADIAAIVLAFAILVVLGPGVLIGPWRHFRKRFRDGSSPD